MKNRNIVRVEYRNQRAWWVRFNRRGKVISKCFTDSIHGGKRKALHAARAWRDATASMIEPSKKPAPPGHGYVRRTHVRGKLSWMAWLRIEDLACKRTTRSVSAWGDRAAKREATAWLERERRALRKRLRVTA